MGHSCSLALCSWCAGKWIGYMYTSPLPFGVSFPSSSPQALSRVPECTLFLLVVCVIHTSLCLPVPVSQFSPLPPPSLFWWPYFYCLCLCFYFTFANGLIYTIFLDFHICMLIYSIWFSLSDLTSLCMTTSRSIYISVKGKISLLFMAE